LATGMSYKIFPTKEFIQDCKKVDSLVLSRVKKKIEEVAENPERYKHLRGPLNEFCRLRIGKLRILYFYDIKKQELYPSKIVFDHNY
jgi:mRNA-degrading endonuclease RelE of RelBE toxin-antitoxin system